MVEACLSLIFTVFPNLLHHDLDEMTGTFDAETNTFSFNPGFHSDRCVLVRLVSRDGGQHRIACRGTPRRDADAHPHATSNTDPESCTRLPMLYLKRIVNAAMETHSQRQQLLDAVSGTQYTPADACAYLVALIENEDEAQQCVSQRRGMVSFVHAWEKTLTPAERADPCTAALIELSKSPCMRDLTMITLALESGNCDIEAVIKFIDSVFAHHHLLSGRPADDNVDARIAQRLGDFARAYHARVVGDACTKMVPVSR